MAAGLVWLLASPLTPRALPAQIVSSTLGWLDVGGARLEQPGSIERRAATVGGGLVHTRSAWGVTWSAGADGAATLTRNAFGAAQYTLRAGMAPQRAPWWRGEVELSRTTTGERLPELGGNRAARLRQLVQHDVGDVRLAWQSFADIGRTPRPSVDFFAPFTAESHAVGTGLDVTRGAWAMGLSVQRSFTDDWPLVEASGGVLAREARYYTYDDATVALTYSAARLSLGASASWRAPRRETRGSARGAAIMAAVPLTPKIALVAQAGEQLADLMRGFPRTRFSSLSVRWQPFGGGAVRREPRVFPDAGRGAIPGATGAVAVVPDVRGTEVLLVRREGQGTITLTIVAPRDATVEIACSATEWAPERLTTHDGRAFVHTLTLPTGSHKLAVRVNGGAWRAPRGLAEAADDYQGTVGVIVVP